MLRTRISRSGSIFRAANAALLPACAMNCPAEAILCDTPENISKILRQRYSQNAAPYGPFAALLHQEVRK